MRNIIKKIFNFFKKEEGSRGMRMSSVILIGYRNILANKFRSVLTIGGVAVGIGIVTFLICLGFGMQEMVIKEVTKENPIDIIDINNGNLDNFVSLNKENREKIKNIKGVQDLQFELNTGGKFYYEESQTDVVVFGATREFLDLAGIKIKYGRIDHDNEDEKVIVSSRLASLLGFENNQDIIGKRVRFDLVLSNETNSQNKGENNIKDNEVEVVAVSEDGENIVAYLFYGWMEKKFEVDLAQIGKAKVDLESGSITEIRKNIEFLGFETESVADVIDDINLFFWIVRIVLIVFGTIIMSISAMGMLNTLSVSLLQRTREVGILKALGAKRKDIFKMFVFEAAIISFVGGTLGFLGGYGLAEVFNRIFNVMSSRRGLEAISFVSMPIYFVVALIAFIAFLGLATGIMPAKRAAKIHALDALRYE